MVDEDFEAVKLRVFDMLDGRLSNVHEPKDIYTIVERVVKTVKADTTKEQLKEILTDIRMFPPIDKYLHDEQVEDIMINNTTNTFIYHSQSGNIKVDERINSIEDLNNFVRKLRVYATTATANKHIYDVHLPNGSRANIVQSPLGPDITIRNFKQRAYSMIDLVNLGELSWEMAGRFWLYAEGLEVRPANLLIGGMPGSGKTTLLNAMFSFFRPEARVVVLEETYELNTETQENCVRLETTTDITLEDLLKNTLRMRPDLILIGEVRGAEAKVMMEAMNVGKIVMSTIHANTSRDIVTRLEHDPMNIDKELIPLVDAFILSSQINQGGQYFRRITQVSETSGIETNVLLSDLYAYDYKTHKGSQILPSVTYRDVLAKLTGYAPSQVMEEERRRARILERLNKLGKKDLRSINEFCRDYYDNPMKALTKIDLQGLGSLY
ncbi:MAG: CpaF family protein [Candidatus Micrarchaeota archaeon]|nr:CpaF family protein [Candidatus Micrarchaeota archaeon]